MAGAVTNHHNIQLLFINQKVIKDPSVHQSQSAEIAHSDRTPARYLISVFLPCKARIPVL